MKINSIYAVIFVIIFSGCSKPMVHENMKYNGIDAQILNIVDSIPICFEYHPFITIDFSVCDENIYVIRFSNGVPIPIYQCQNEEKILISQVPNFLGYKKYKNAYLIFFENNPEEMSKKFIQKDSLGHDEEIFQHYHVYERLDNKIRDCNPVIKYLINEKDSLIFYEGKCLFDIE